MKRQVIGVFLGIFLALLAAFHGAAATYYVNAGNPAPISPYTSWATAATNIQDAINVSTNGDLILVTNGIYQYGGAIMAGSLSNRVALSNPVTVQSVNGPWVTTIYGAGAVNGATAVRCAWLTNGATLTGFTLQGGATLSSGNNTTINGGAAWCASSNAMVANCVIVSNTAAQYGGGVYQGTVINSLVSTNGTSFPIGGATYQTILEDCTLVSNTTYGAASPIAMTNCIIYFNNPAIGNYTASGSAFSHCCTTPALSGVGNFTNAPQFFADGVHLGTNSPCIGAGISIATGTDVFGQMWSNPPSIGCAEWQPSPVVATPGIQLTGNPVGFAVRSTFSGVAPLVCYWLENGVPLQDNGHFSGTQTANLLASGVSFSDASAFQLVVSNSYGMVTSVVAQLVIHCVNVAGTSPVPPYTTWATAATDIQDAITAAVAGDVVLVTNGIYATGGISMDGVITNRVSVNKAILVDSVNGASATIIQGAWDPTSTDGPEAVRCAWLTTNAILNSFTLCGGATRAYSTGGQGINGGGVWGPANGKVPAALVANCLIISNAASDFGGGAYQVNLNYCTIATNAAIGSGSAGGVGGGAAACNLLNCVVTGNTALGSSSSSGGGLDNCGATNCAVTRNISFYYGGGVYLGTLANCTITGNQATSTSTGYGGGVASSSLANSIVYGNLNFSAPYAAYSNSYSSSFSYCCTPGASGGGNIGSNPLLLADGIHLSASSPCIGAGNESIVSGTDIDGQPWNNPPSIGCDEWQPAPAFLSQPFFQVAPSPGALTVSVVPGGEPPFSCYWTQNGNPIQDDGHHVNSSTASLVVNSFGPGDAGVYQVVVSNSFGMVTSQVAQLVIHAVNVAGSNPVPPYTSWATAATDIQDAVNVSTAGDIVLVTNGIYSTGGMVMSSGLTNRVAVNQSITVTSVNGYLTTVIQGAWDPITTNGPDAVRCVWLANGALLTGFTLENGATLSSGDGSGGGPLESGGGIYCLSTNGVVSDCVLSNNTAVWGGGIVNGTLNNSLAYGNHAVRAGGGVYDAALNNCTVQANYTFLPGGAGIYGSYLYTVRNSIVADNFDYPSETIDNSYPPSSSGPTYSFSCISPTASGAGNTNVNPQLLDYFHIAATSPCRGAGNATFSSGTDLDGEAWNSPPSMGCDEVVPADLVGPLSVTIFALNTNLVLNHLSYFNSSFGGRVATTGWSFGDGTTATNSDIALHEWTNSGNYPVTFTAYNNDNPNGVSATVMVQVEPLLQPQLQFPGVAGGAFQFEFPAQEANYTIQYATNLTPPISWHTLQSIFMNPAGVVQVSDPATTNEARFYRVSAQ